jgi:DNA-3-methyladenine glycosylase II
VWNNPLEFARRSSFWELLVSNGPRRSSGAAGSNHEAERRRKARQAIRHLRAAEPSLGQIIDHVGAHHPIITPDPFIALAGSITQQQVSMSAAAAIYGRIRDLCPRRRVTPRAILALSEAELRGAGLSRQKAAYLGNLAAAFASRTLTATGLRRLSDEDVIATTTRIKGVGRWTAEMLLIFCLERADIWPADDLGLRKAVQRYLQLDQLPAAKTMHALAEPWRPYRTYASWYLWRSLEGPLMPGIAL